MSRALKTAAELALVLGALPSIAALAQEPSAADRAAMEEAWKRAATPGEHHALLQGMVGQWKFVSRWWDDPAAPPQQMAGSSSNEMFFDGRFLKQEVYADAVETGGAPFRGFGIMAYDNVRAKYATMWVDNTSTGMLHAEGTYDPVAKILTSEASYTDPMTGAEKHLRMVTTFSSPCRHVTAFLETGPDGKERTTMEIEYRK